jgi:hypothetical protein
MKWKGELAALPPMIEKAVKGVHDLGVPLNLHAKGDAAIDTFLKIHGKVAADDLGRDRHVTLTPGATSPTHSAMRRSRRYRCGSGKTPASAPSRTTAVRSTSCSATTRCSARATGVARSTT